MLVAETRVDEDEALHQLTLLYYLPEVDSCGNIVDQGSCRKRNDSFPFWPEADGRWHKVGI